MIFSGMSIFVILMALMVAAIVIYLERFMELRRAQIDYQDFLKGVINILDANNEDEALAVCEDIAAPVSSVVSTAIRHRHSPARVLREAVDSQGRAEIGRLDRRLMSLAVIAQIAPLLGLLGTLIGFVKAVMILNAGELVSRPELLTKAVEAIIPSIGGLAVMIPVMVMYSSLRSRLDRTVSELEAAASQIVGYISTRKEEKREAVK